MSSTRPPELKVQTGSVNRRPLPTPPSASVTSPRPLPSPPAPISPQPASAPVHPTPVRMLPSPSGHAHSLSQPEISSLPLQTTITPPSPPSTLRHTVSDSGRHTPANRKVEEDAIKKTQLSVQAMQDAHLLFRPPKLRAKDKDKSKDTLNIMKWISAQDSSGEDESEDEKPFDQQPPLWLVHRDESVWVREESGKRWEEKNYNEVIRTLRHLK